MRESADIVIIGGGIMGCSMLYHLARLGAARPLLLEREVLGAGSTGRSQAICRTHYSNPITASMAWESLKVYTNFGDLVGGTAGFIKTGYVVVVEEVDRPGLELNIAMQQDLGISAALVTADELREIAPMLESYDGEGLAYEPESGYANPYLATTSYAARARELGADIVTRILYSGRLVGTVHRNPGLASNSGPGARRGRAVLRRRVQRSWVQVGPGDWPGNGRAGPAGQGGVR